MGKYQPIDDKTTGPVTTVRFDKPGGGPTDFEKKQGILDTGSPITYIPASLVHNFGLPIIDRIPVTGVSGRTHLADVCEVNLTLVDPDFSRAQMGPVRVCVWDSPSALIGRDILRGFVITFDGPNQEWRVNSQAAQSSGHAILTP